MKKKILFLILCFSVFVANSQNISVTNFYRDNTDLTARTHPVTNDNAEKCALLKIITTEKGFGFEPDAYGICKDVEYKMAEVWVWLAPGSRRITIKHPQLGQLRDYEYPEHIESATVYVMELKTEKINHGGDDVNTSNYVVLHFTPADALLTIDGKSVQSSEGVSQNFLKIGKHEYELSNLYYTERGTFEINPDNKTEFTVAMKPKFGYLSISSTPESGAYVYLDEQKVGTTPFKSDKLSSGMHTVQLVKKMYKEVKQQIQITDGQTTELSVNMLPDYAQTTITCSDPEAEIWINGEFKQKGNWAGRLAAGPYKIEARKDFCRSVAQQLDLIAGEQQSIELSAPTPICGKLNVMTTPYGADILLDGKKIGTSPELLNKIQIGPHSLELRKAGCASVIRQITISEGQMLEVNETLKTGKEITLNTNPPGGAIYVDGNSIGLSPVNTTLSFGNHIRENTDFKFCITT